MLEKNGEICYDKGSVTICIVEFSDALRHMAMYHKMYESKIFNASGLK